MSKTNNNLQIGSEYDYNKDGVIDCGDVDSYERITKANLLSKRDSNHVKLAWVAMISIIVVTMLLFSPQIPDSRIRALSDVLDLFYICQASVIGFYVGAKTYLERNKPI